MQETLVYRIKVKGQVPESWSERLQGMSILVNRSGENGVMTTIEGPLRDRAALASVLNTLYEKHFALVAVARIKQAENQ